MNYQDKTIKCFDCEREFVFTATEQTLYNAIGHTHAPKRCPSCRQARKARKPENNGNSYTRQSYSNPTPHQTFHVVCAECGKETEVPFQPRPGKPVYCGACYRKVRVSR